MSVVSGLDQENRPFKFATRSIVGQNIPFVLAVESVRESSAWDENPSNQVHRIVRRLLQRAKEHVPIKTVLCDREFDSMRVYQTLSNLEINYLIPKLVSSFEQDVLNHFEADDQEVVVELASVHVKTGSHPMRFLYVPSTEGEERQYLQLISGSVQMKPKHSVAGIVTGGRSKTSTKASRTTSWRKRPRRTIGFGYSTLCSPCYCTISGGSLTSC